MSLRSCLALLLCLGTPPLGATEVAWPTTMERAAIRTPADYLQPTVSGKLESALFGMVREDGRRFHEGIDIKPSRTDREGEPLDLVLAAMDGEVAYLNPKASGGYGQYIVLLHAGAEIPVYTLYAHLARIEPSLRVGQPVRRGKSIGLMGRTADADSPITKDRAHLHFEVGLVLSKGFNLWYASQPENKQSRNLHGLFNGMNLVGMDPLLVIGKGKVDVLAALRSQPTAFTVGLRTSKPPDFVTRYPALVRGDPTRAVGWYVEFSWQGMPTSWTALAADSPHLPAGRWRLLEIDQTQRMRLIQRKVLGSDGASAGELLRQNVEILLSPTR